MAELTPHHRVDLYLPNDSEGFCLLAAELLDALPRDDAAGWQECVRDGLVMPLALDAAEGPVLGVRLGSASAKEEAEGVAERRSWLQLPSGMLALTSGSLFWEWTGLEEPVLLRVPPGDYAVRCLRFATGVNGRRWLEVVRRSGETALAFYQRTRPGGEPPDWLRLLDALHLEVDGSESWDLDEATYEALEESVLDQSYLDFLIELQPLETKPVFPGLQGPWLRENPPRLPARCPQGIRAATLLEPETGPNLLEQMFEEVGALVGEALAQLPEPEVLFEGESGRFSVWDGASWATASFERAAEVEALGFASLGTLACEARPGALFRVLCAGPVYAVVQRTSDGAELLSFLSRSVDGQVWASRGEPTGAAADSGQALLARHKSQLEGREAEPLIAGPDLAEAARCLDALWAAGAPL